MKHDKRRLKRIMLGTPIDGQLNKQSVRIIDLSTAGARVEHPVPMAGRKVVDLRINVEDETLVVSCEIVRSRLQRSAVDSETIVYSSGLRFVDPAQESRSAIRELVASLVERQALEPQGSPGVLSVAV